MRGGLCTVRNRVVAMLARELKCALSGCRLDFQLNMRSVRVCLLVQPNLRMRARALVRGGFCVAPHGMVAVLAWGLKCALSGCRFDFQLNMRPVRVRLLVQPTLRLLCAYARAWGVMYCPQYKSRHVSPKN